MTESNLSYKIFLCDSIQRLNDIGCLEVMKLLQYEQNCPSLNQFLIRILLKLTENSNVRSLQHMKNKMIHIITNEQFIDIQKKENMESINNKNTSLSLFKLPIDIIQATSLFLNAGDIFTFEKCCRLFYQIINNTSYLRQSNNFKTFKLTDKRLNQITDRRYSFYKYSQAESMHVLVCGLNSTVQHETQENVTTFVNATQLQWELAQCIDILYEFWLANLFKSIKTLVLHEDATLALLDKFPLELLFDANSCLERLTINFYWNCKKFAHFQTSIIQFENQYLNLRQKYQQEGKQIKKLQLLKCRCGTRYNGIVCPRYIEAEHLILILPYFDYTFQVQQLLSTIRILTCRGSIGINIPNLHSLNCNIDTLRLIDFDMLSAASICVDENMIKTLNLDQSLVNLTIDIKFDMIRFESKCIQWIQAIEKILCKHHYQNLKNVNLLITLYDMSISFDKIFNLLKQISVSKQQFDQLNIGLKIWTPGDLRVETYYTFECGQQCDGNYKFLDAKQQEVKHRINLNTAQTSLPIATDMDHQGNKHKVRYYQWLYQWHIDHNSNTIS